MRPPWRVGVKSRKEPAARENRENQGGRASRKRNRPSRRWPCSTFPPGCARARGTGDDRPCRGRCCRARPNRGRRPPSWCSCIFPPDRREIQLHHDGDRKSTRLNSSHGYISYAVFCLKKKTRLI